MENQSTLNGTLVLVRPDLKDDPVQKQGQIGIVVYDRARDEIYVEFLKGGQGVYDGDTLLKLKAPSTLEDELARNGDAMDVNDFKAIYKMTMLQQRGTAGADKAALEIARDQPSIWDRALDVAAPSQKHILEKAHAR